MVIITKLPYILYFDDFMGAIPDRINLAESAHSEWKQTIEEVLLRCNKNYTLQKLQSSEIDDITTDSIIDEMNKKLTDEITGRWTSMQLGNEKNQFKIELKFDKQSKIFNIRILEESKGQWRHFFS